VYSLGDDAGPVLFQRNKLPQIRGLAQVPLDIAGGADILLLGLLSRRETPHVRLVGKLEDDEAYDVVVAWCRVEPDRD